MEGGKRSKSKKAAAAQEEVIDTKKPDEFVEKMKKRATVKVHGIDNVCVSFIINTGLYI